MRGVIPGTDQPSYRALLSIPRLGRVIVSMQVARVAQQMVSVAMVLFVLDHFGSAELAGLVTLTSILPGLLLAPIAGALLDRHGRTRLIIVDYLVALVAFVLLGGLALADVLTVPLLLAITVLSSLTSVLSHTGLRSLFPLLVPRHLWERVNAIDSNGYVVATILGPPAAAALVSIVGGPLALMVIGLSFGIAAVALIGAPDPVSDTTTSGNLLRDAWDGLRYTWSNRTLRGLGFSIATLNLAGGMTAIVIPLIVLERLQAGEVAVGLVFATSGITGMVSAFLAGRIDTRGREWRMLVVPMVMYAPALALLLPAAQTTDVVLGLVLASLSFASYGALTGPMDIALFTVRQRRTDPAWMGRAFAVSMAFNFAGYPVGAALAGYLAARSIESAILVGIAAVLVAAALAAVLVPRRDAGADAAARAVA